MTPTFHVPNLILPGKLLAGQRRMREPLRPTRFGREIRVWAPVESAIQNVRAMNEWLAHAQVGRMPVIGGGTADAWQAYDGYREHSMTTIDNDSDTFQTVLTVEVTNADDDTTELYGSLTGELATLDGYTQGGFVHSSPAMTFSGATGTWDLDDATWTAAGGSLVFRYASIFDNTPTTPVDPMCLWTTLDNTPGDITVNDTEVFTIQINASGVFTLTGA